MEKMGEMVTTDLTVTLTTDLTMMNLGLTRGLSESESDEESDHEEKRLLLGSYLEMSASVISRIPLDWV